MAEMRNFNQQDQYMGSMERKETNRNRSLLILKENGIPHQMITLDHYRVSDWFHYWPSNGLFINTKTQEEGRGVFNLIRKVKSDDKRNQ